MFPAIPADEAGNPKRCQIIEGAAAIFNQSGYDGASMSRIADRAGVSKGTLYNYFESKSALFAAFVERETGARVAWVMQPSEPEPPVEVFLAGVARRLIRTLLSHSSQTLHRIVISEAVKFPDLARIYLDAGYTRGCAEFAHWLGLQASRGLMSIGDPMLAAEQFSALCRTRLWIRRCLDVDAPTSDDEVDAIADSSVVMFLNTYGPARPGRGQQ